MSADRFDLSGKIAVVTGASRGIGEAFALALAQQGAKVIVSSRKLDGCQVVADAIKAAGGEAEAVPCHVGDMPAIQNLFAHIREHYGRIDILVNNAATNPYFGDILDTDLDSFQKTLDVNFRGYFFMSVEAGKLMREQGGGVIVNTASVAGLHPDPMLGIYSISKAAVINMTKAFAKGCAKYGIRCNAILPGVTETKFASALFDNEDMHKALMSTVPMGRHAVPEEMVGTLLYLVSDASSYTNGACLVVDGGMTT